MKMYKKNIRNELFGLFSIGSLVL